MVVLDIDHLTEFQIGTSADEKRLQRRLIDSGDSFATTQRY